jgi:hypothetical protein
MDNGGTLIGMAATGVAGFFLGKSFSSGFLKGLPNYDTSPPPESIKAVAVSLCIARTDISVNLDHRYMFHYTHPPEEFGGYWYLGLAYGENIEAMFSVNIAADGSMNIEIARMSAAELNIYYKGSLVGTFPRYDGQGVAGGYIILNA